VVSNNIESLFVHKTIIKKIAKEELGSFNQLNMVISKTVEISPNLPKIWLFHNFFFQSVLAFEKKFKKFPWPC
jgi:hypothetical protein